MKSRPRLSPRLGFAAQVLMGALVGVGLAVIAFPLSVVIEMMLGPGEEGGQFFVGFIGPAIFFPVGAALGVTLAGKWVERRGRFWHALVGAFAAMVVMALIAGPLGMSDLLITVLTALMFLLPPLFAALAHNRFARPTDPLNPYDDGEVDLLKYHDEGWEDHERFIE